MLARPEAELRRESNGKESWVFRASRPEDLLGLHAERVNQALQSGEKLNYLLYSPMWEGSGGPFGIRAAPASHAVAVTDSRFVISQDRHMDDLPPTLLSIPFQSVVGVESGSALMLAWLVIRYVETGSPRATTVLYRALGRKHFLAATRAYRLAARTGVAGHQARSSDWSSVWHQVGERHREELEPLLIESELPLATVAWRALVGRRQRRRKAGLVCMVPAGALFVSTHGLFLIGDEPHALPRSPNFGVNALCVPLGALRAATLVDLTTSGPCALALRLEVGREGASAVITTPFPGERLQGLEDVLARLAGHPALGEVRWSS